MAKFSPGGQKWLKGFHILCACMWLGAAICLTFMLFFMKATDDMELYGINVSMKFIDDFIIVPGAIGSLLTGLLYSIFTGWGWFKHKWITVKWSINIYGILFGTFLLGPWTNSLVPLSREKGLNALSDSIYTGNRAMILYWGSFQLATLIFAVFISI